jgi:hypothetical protein
MFFLLNNYVVGETDGLIAAKPAMHCCETHQYSIGI